MTAQNDLDRTLGAWFGAEAAPAVPPEPLARIIESTRGLRPRPSVVAGIGSHAVGVGPTSGIGSLASRLRPALVIALVALLTLALVGGALLVGGRLAAPTPLPRTYLSELVSSPDLSAPMLRPVLTPLLDGQVLAIGNRNPGAFALVYDPATGGSVTPGPMVSANQLTVSSAVALHDGRVLVIGDPAIQIFDPTNSQFAPVGPRVTPRFGGDAALLHDGRVLLTGGGASIEGGPVLPADLFDPETLTFSATGPVGIVNPGRTATLPDGRVFLAEGPGDHPEIYDPATGTFSAASTMSGVGGKPVALADGRVVLVGSTGLYSRGTVEVWSPVGNTVSWISLDEPLSDAVPLDDGRVLLIGMCRGRDTGWTGLFDPTTVVVTPGPPTQACRPTPTRLADGRVLIVGGDIDELTPSRTVQVFR
jgi:hypothetical protein